MEKSNEAVIVVDYQNDFANPGDTQKGIERGSLYVNGGEKLQGYIYKLMEVVKARSGLVITTQDWHPRNHTSFAVNHYLKPFTEKDGEIKWPIHCLQDERGSELFLHDRLIDERIYKGFDPEKECYSGFGGNKLKFGRKRVGSCSWDGDVENRKDIVEIGDSLNEVLQGYNVQTLHIVGLATDYCVKATALDGIEHGFQVKLHKNGIAAVNAVEGDEKRAIEEMQDNKVELVVK